MASSLPNEQQRFSVEAKVRSLINNDLKEICRGENLAVSGIKAQLQTRILQHIDVLVKSGDVRGFERIRYRVNHHGLDTGFSSPVSNFDSATSMSPAPTRQMATGYNRPPLPTFQAARPHGYNATRSVQFRSSPFYNKIEPITAPQELTEMQNNRHTVNMFVNLNATHCERLRADPNQRVMVYCSAAMPISPFTPLDISFPSQIEVKVNGDDVKSNFKGLKNKPGTTKPADITDFLRKASGYNNNLQITYALTTKVRNPAATALEDVLSLAQKYSVVVNLVHKTSAESLADRIKNGRFISKDQVLKEIVEKANDTDIITTSTVMSLKDPISTMRMSLPCRSLVCTHNQCFDGSYFLQLQEQAPTWTCPVCNKSISYESLSVDQYVQDILQKTNSSTEQVTIEPDGSWHPVVQSDESGNRGKPQARAAYDNDSDDDIVEIQDTRVDKIKHEAASMTPGIAQQTPPLSSREPSMAVSSHNRPSSKRPSAVIDLTLSDDEDEPRRPAKRTHTSQSKPSSYNHSTSLPEVRHTDLGYRQSSAVGSGYLMPPLQPGGQINRPWPIGGPSQSTVWLPFGHEQGNGSVGYNKSPP